MHQINLQYAFNSATEANATCNSAQKDYKSQSNVDICTFVHIKVFAMDTPIIVASIMSTVYIRSYVIQEVHICLRDRHWPKNETFGLTIMYSFRTHSYT